MTILPALAIETWNIHEELNVTGIMEKEINMRRNKEALPRHMIHIFDNQNE